MGRYKIPKKVLLNQAKRAHQDLDKPVIMTADTEARHRAFQKASDRNFCPICGTKLEHDMECGYSGKCEDWWVKKLCPKCGVVKETESGVEKTGEKTLQKPIELMMAEWDKRREAR